MIKKNLVSIISAAGAVFFAGCSLSHVFPAEILMRCEQESKIFVKKAQDIRKTPSPYRDKVFLLPVTISSSDSRYVYCIKKQVEKQSNSNYSIVEGNDREKKDNVWYISETL